VTAQGTAIRLRSFVGGDEQFLRDLYGDRRAAELQLLGWPPAEQQVFIEMQFRAQQSGYGAAFPAAEHWVVVVDDERAARLLVDRQADADTVVDVAVLSRYRGLGIGTVLVQGVLADAEAVDRPVRLTVLAHDQRLIGWYERLGFVKLEQHGPHLGMEWRAPRAEGK